MKTLISLLAFTLTCSAQEHRFGAFIGGPATTSIGQQVDVTLRWENHCDFGDNQEWHSAIVSVDHAFGTVITPNLVPAPITIASNSSHTLTFSFIVPPEDASLQRLIIYADFLGVDPGGGLAGATIGHSPIIMQPRLQVLPAGGGYNQLVFTQPEGAAMELQASDDAVHWETVHYIPPMLSRTWSFLSDTSGGQRFFRLKL